MPKETELKYAVSADAWDGLLKIDRIGTYVLGAEKRKEIHDIYADTADRAISKHGFAFRIRSDGANRAACLKSLDSGDGMGHTRDEFECSIGSATVPEEWPAGETRDQFLAMTGAAEVYAEVEIHQTRHKRHLLSENEIVAEVSFDEVRVRVGDDEHVFFELEVELLSDAFMDSMGAWNDELVTRYGLIPVASSKFERAMAIRDAHANPE